MKSIEELKALRDKMKAQVELRDGAQDGTRIVVGMATCGIAAGARPVLTAITDEIGKRGISGVAVTQTGCIGICQYEPVVEVFDADGTKTTYVKMSPEKIPKIIVEHIVNHKPVLEYTIGTVAK